MEKRKKKEKKYRSIREFEDRFFPKTPEEQIEEASPDAGTLGRNLARRSLEKIKSQLLRR